MPAAEIHVDDEYGNLREVIVGRADLRYPDVDRAGWAAEALKVLCSTHPLVRRLGGGLRA